MFRGSKLMRSSLFCNAQPRARYENVQALIRNQVYRPRTIFTSTSLSPRPAVSYIGSDCNDASQSSPSPSSVRLPKRRGKMYQNDATKSRRRTPVPIAYRRPEEQDQNTKWVSSNDNRGIHSSRKSIAKTKRLKREINTLIRVQDQTKGLIKQYEEQLGIPAISSPNEPAAENRDDFIQKATFADDIDLTTLVQTEKAYSRICVQLRQLTAGWSSIRTDYGGRMDNDVISSLMDASQDITNREQMMKNPIPAEIAYSHLVQLETIRRQRETLIGVAMGKPEPRSSVGVMGWLTKKVEVLLKDIDRENEGLQLSGSSQISLERLKAHLAADYTADQNLYGEVMKSFVYWQDIPLSTQVPEYDNANRSRDRPGTREIRRKTAHGNALIPQPTYTSAMLLAERLDSVTSTMIQSFQSGNPNCRPLRINYHLLIKYFSLTNSKQYAMRASKILHAMEEGDRDGTDNQSTGTKRIDGSVISSTCTPTLITYNKVLKVYRSVAGNRSESRENRRWVVLEAEKLLFRLHAKKTNATPNLSTSPTGAEDSNVTPHTYGLSIASYDLVLNSLYATGHLIVPDMCDRVDKIMETMMGKQAYLAWIGERKSSSQLIKAPFQPDMKIHHILILIFSTTRSPSKLARARAILNSVEEQHTLLSKEGDRSSDLQKISELQQSWPTCRAYNSFLAGLNSLASVELKRTLKKKQVSSGGGNYPTIESNAKYAMNLLDSMIKRHASMPDTDTFHYIMRLWSVSGSKSAGERGEELLSRMEIQSACNYDERYDSMNPNHLSYEIALECWATSANAMEPGAARRALMLLERMESQCHKLDSKEGGETRNTLHQEELASIYNTNLSVENETSFVHSAAIHACTVTRLNSDKDDAFRIAFDVYNRMIEHEVIPTQLIYRDLLNCCLLLPASAQRRRIQLSQTVFEAACENGCVDVRVLAALKQVNSELRKSYEPLPEHSAALRELKRRFV